MKSDAISQETLPRPKIRRTHWLRELLDTALLVVAIYALVNLASARYMVQGKSMYPNFDDNQVLYVSRLNYMIDEPSRLDIVVFHYPRNPEEDYIKRVIGLPGDAIEIRNTIVYVNGQPLEEPYINEACLPRECPDTAEPLLLGPDEYFVMGDNRNNSSDSRDFGPVKRQFLVGEVLVRYWPPESWGIVNRIGAPAGAQE
ncbi:MAG: signal peptidase I [Anaerolineaceae bacterium]|nr:signal peptidase I [Anaerolineaceae bacterium]